MIQQQFYGHLNPKIEHVFGILETRRNDKQKSFRNGALCARTIALVHPGALQKQKQGIIVEIHIFLKRKIKKQYIEQRIPLPPFLSFILFSFFLIPFSIHIDNARPRLNE